MSETIVNRVQRSGIITVDFEAWLENKTRFGLDIQPWLWQGIALKEKDFREAVEQHPWQQYENAYVAVFCSEDAIIPTWAYMLIAAKLQFVNAFCVVGTENQVIHEILKTEIAALNPEDFTDKRVVVKGCGKVEVHPDIYAQFTQKVSPHARMLMFGEPCSTVPVSKKTR
jgi:hypothetical protein